MPLSTRSGSIMTGRGLYPKRFGFASRKPFTNDPCSKSLTLVVPACSTESSHPVDVPQFPRAPALWRERASTTVPDNDWLPDEASAARSPLRYRGPAADTGRRGQ